MRLHGKFRYSHFPLIIRLVSECGVTTTGAGQLCDGGWRLLPTSTLARCRNALDARSRCDAQGGGQGEHKAALALSCFVAHRNLQNEGSPTLFSVAPHPTAFGRIPVHSAKSGDSSIRRGPDVRAHINSPFRNGLLGRSVTHM